VIHWAAVRAKTPGMRITAVTLVFLRRRNFSVHVGCRMSFAAAAPSVTALRKN